MRLSAILLALPLAQPASAAPLLGGLLGGGGGGGGGLLGGLLGGGGGAGSNDPAPATGTAGGAQAVFGVVDNLKDTITGMVSDHPSLETGSTDVEEASDLLFHVGIAVSGALGDLSGIANPAGAPAKRDFADDEAAENNAAALAQIVDSIEDVITKLSEDVKANEVVGRLFTTLDNNLFLVLQAVEEIEPGTLDRVDKILDRLDGTVDKVLDLVDGLFG